MVWTLEQVAEATLGELIEAPKASLSIGSVETDTRAISPGALFVALRGDRFDGHDYLQAAREGGAIAAMVQRRDVVPAGFPAIVVDETLSALQAFAAWHRQRMNATIVGLTGSAGKTTTKELTSAILAEMGPTHKTQGNLNNHIGVPLTLLQLRESHRYSIVEMGCNDFGEIKLLSTIASPTIGLITNVGEAHLEKLGDLDGVARAKGELFAQLPTEGTAVVNVEDERVRQLPSPAARRFEFGASEGATVRLVERTLDQLGHQTFEIAIDLPGVDSMTISPTVRLLGLHNAKNALAATALALAAGATAEAVVAGLQKVSASPGRLELKQTAAGVSVIDDTYNANPGAVRAALELLAEYRRGAVRVHAVLGEMLELGESSAALHEGVGRAAAERGVDTLVAVGAPATAVLEGARGAGMEEAKLFSVETPEEAAPLIEARVRRGDIVLVKGSRGAQMERTVTALGATGEEGGA